MAILFISALVSAQNIGIGTATPNASAALDISNTAKGLLIPRMTSTGITAIASPAKGLMVYDSLNNQLMINMGTAQLPSWQNIVSSSGWGLQGNSGINPSAQFIGTTDNQPLLFRVNNNTAGAINPSTKNTFWGMGSGLSNINGTLNTANGYSSFTSNTSGVQNTSIGAYTLASNTTGSNNVAVGYLALSTATTGNGNVAIGVNVLGNDNSGNVNTSVGVSSMTYNTSGVSNAAYGAYSLLKNDIGSYNTAAGVNALSATTASQFNTAIGYNAGGRYDNGYNNVFVGANTDVNGAAYYNVIAIGQGTICTAPSQVTMGNGATGSYRAYANWSNISDGRFKKNIQENVPGLDFISQLRPVTYNLNATGLDAFLHNGSNTGKPAMTNTRSTGKTGDTIITAPYSDAARSVYNNALKEKEQVVQSGFVAQEVEATAKKLGFNFSGIDAPKNESDVYGLRYAEFVVPLVKAVQEQQQMIVELQKQIDALKALIKK